MDEWIRDFIAEYLARKDYRLVLNGNCVSLARNFMAPDEDIMMQIRQSYIKDIAPDWVLVTNKKIIILRPSFWGLYSGHDILSPTGVSVVPYNNIITIVMTKGKILSTVNMRISGFISAGHSGNGSKYEGEVRGLPISDALLLTNFLQEFIELRDEKSKPTAPTSQT